MKLKYIVVVALVVNCFCVTFDALALDQIIHPYQSVRSAGMGNVRITTGLFEDNFFGNPARAAANPRWRVTLFAPSVELNSNTINTVKSLTGGGDFLQNVGSSAGEENHGRLQTTMPAFYMPTLSSIRTAFAFGLITSTQFDIDLRRSFQISPQAVIDVGPAFTVAHTFLKDDALAIGVTAHAIYRLSSSADLGFVSLLKGTTLSVSNLGGEGGMFDFDLGATYTLPVKWKGFEFSFGAAVDNTLGGTYSNMKMSIAKVNNPPLAQPRSIGIGAVMHRNTWWKFRDTSLALEVSDIGNNTNGSFYRMLHLGAETQLWVLIPRVGINQGYLTFGVGFETRLLSIEYANYGEELSLNTGGLENRINAVRLAFHISGAQKSYEPTAPSETGNYVAPETPAVPATPTTPEAVPALPEGPAAPAVPAGTTGPELPAAGTPAAPAKPAETTVPANSAEKPAASAVPQEAPKSEAAPKAEAAKPEAPKVEAVKPESLPKVEPKKAE